MLCFSKRITAWSLGVGIFFFWFSARWGIAQEDDPEEKRRKVLVQQLTCLKGCQDKFHPRVSRCSRVDYSSSCFMYAKLYMIECLNSCKAPWFCEGFRKSHKSCPSNCMKDEAKKIRAKQWDKKRKRWYRFSKAQQQRLWTKAQHGCNGTCRIMGDHCGADFSFMDKPPAFKYEPGIDD
jgi:hypothetical protein